MKNTPLALIGAACLGAASFHAHAQSMSVDSLDGPVTQNEINSFVSYIGTITPVVWPNTTSMENEYAQGASGERIKAMGLMYEISQNAAILNRMIVFCDTVLSQRNDLLAAPNGQRTYWNGKISPAWPGQAVGTNPTYSTSASGDCVGHLANCARLILETPAIWNTTVPDGNPFGYGGTYLQRAQTYVSQADFTFSQCFFPDMLTLTNSGLTNIYCYPAGYPYKPGGQYPWNQAMMMSYPLQNLAICHGILGDNPSLESKYDTLVSTNVMRFFNDSGQTLHKLVTDGAGNQAYDWSYAVPGNGGEDSNHGSLDVAGFYRAFDTNRYGITASQMTPFANMVVDILTGTIGSYYHGTVEGVDGTGHAASTTYLRSGYFFTAEFRPDQYYNLVSGLHITAPGTTTSIDAFSRLMWIKNLRYLGSQDFSLAASPSSQPVTAGNAVSYAVTVTAVNGFSGAVSFAAGGLPSGVTAGFSPSTVNGSGTTTLTLSTTSEAAAGTDSLSVQGTSGTLSHTIPVSLVVSNPAAAPSFSPAGGSYTSAQSVTISTATSGASIRYTTDGSLPSETTGTLYAGPVTVSSSETVKAIAYKSGYTDSAVSSAAYTISSGGPAQFTIPTSAATASGYHTGYPPANAVDGSMTTRWAQSGDGCWIQFDLGSVNTVDYVEIAWYDGSTRTYTFDVQISNDASTWTTLLNRKVSSGTTDSFEPYTFTPTAGRYLRIVGHLSSVDSYTNIVEFQAWGTAASGSNLAPSGTAYGWKANTSSTSNANRTAQPGLNDNNLTADVDLDAAGDAVNAWEGAGVVWSSAHTITSADFINGTVTSGGDGFLTANCTLQFSTDGSTWTNSGWTCAPAYPNSSAASGRTYTFSGSPATNLKGARIVGQVRTTDTSYHWIVKEVQFVGQ